MVDANFLQRLQMGAKKRVARSEAQMSRLWRRPGVVDQTDIQRLHGRLVRPARCPNPCPPVVERCRLRVDAARVGHPAVAMARKRVGVLLTATRDEQRQLADHLLGQDIHAAIGVAECILKRRRPFAHAPDVVEAGTKARATLGERDFKRPVLVGRSPEATPRISRPPDVDVPAAGAAFRNEWWSNAWHSANFGFLHPNSAAAIRLLQLLHLRAALGERGRGPPDRAGHGHGVRTAARPRRRAAALPGWWQRSRRSDAVAGVRGEGVVDDEVAALAGALAHRRRGARAGGVEPPQVQARPYIHAPS